MADKREVELTIISRGDSGTVRQKVRGTLYMMEGRAMYHYREPDSEMGRVTATLKTGPGLIRLLRQGDIRSEQQFSLNKRMPGYYDMPHGRFELETETRKLRISLEDGLGQMAWTYDLYVNGERSGRMELRIDVKEAPPSDS